MNEARIFFCRTKCRMMGAARCQLGVRRGRWETSQSTIIAPADAAVAPARMTAAISDRIRHNAGIKRLRVRICRAGQSHTPRGIRRFCAADIVREEFRNDRVESPAQHMLDKAMKRCGELVVIK